MLIKDVDALVKNLPLKGRGWFTVPVKLYLYASLCCLRLIWYYMLQFLFLVAVRVLIDDGDHCGTYPLPLTFFFQMSKEG